MSKLCPKGKIINPITKRCIQINGDTYKKLLQKGLLNLSPKTSSVLSSLRRSPKRVTTEVLIHDNGGRPFKVKITPTSVDVLVNHQGKYKHFKTWENYLRIWIGEDKNNKKFSYGNSILVQLTKNKYLLIGMEIVTFTLNRKIKEYHSPIGRNDVPYPWFLDEDDNVYLLVTPTEIEYFKVSEDVMNTFDDCASSDLVDLNKRNECEKRGKSDPYRELWGNKTIPKTAVRKLSSVLIHPRV
jgi:hypothetical protein